MKKTKNRKISKIQKYTYVHTQIEKTAKNQKLLRIAAVKNGEKKTGK